MWNTKKISYWSCRDNSKFLIEFILLSLHSTILCNVFFLFLLIDCWSIFVFFPIFWYCIIDLVLTYDFLLSFRYSILCNLYKCSWLRYCTFDMNLKNYGLNHKRVFLLFTFILLILVWNSSKLLLQKWKLFKK